MSAHRRHTPADLSITSRNLSFAEAASSQRWWHGGDPVATAFYNALSASFPLGERYFIDSVKHFRHRADAELQKQIETFITQESIHTREHVAFNDIAEEHGYDLGRFNDLLRRRLRWARSRAPLEQLASTIALEHFTAILAHELLRDPRHLAGAPDSIQRLWRWHAVEEIEHKGVAYDTYLAATAGFSGIGRWALRSYVMLATTCLFLHEILFGVREFFRQDGLSGATTWLRFGRYVLIQPGILRRIFGSYFRFYGPGFHPWRVDDRALVQAFESAVAR